MSGTPVYKVLDCESMKVKLEGYSLTVEEWKEAEGNETRAKIIVDDALFADTLREVIKSALPRKDDATTMLLQSIQFGDRARLAYALGLIEKRTMQDLHRIHNVRNKWAHSDKPKFSAREWRRDVLALSTVGKKKGQVTEKNYLDFFWDAVQDCRKAILDAMRRADPTLMQIVDYLHGLPPEKQEAFLKEVERRQDEKKRGHSECLPSCPGSGRPSRRA